MSTCDEKKRSHKTSLSKMKPSENVLEEKPVDNSQTKMQNTQTYKMEIVWSNVVVLSLLHIAGFYGFYLRYTETKLATIIFAKTCYILSGFGVTAGAHRLWCHRCYKAETPVQVLLMLLNSVTYQNSIYTWSRDHRIHHKYTDTDADPHNSKRGFFFSHMGWLLVRKHPELREKGKTIDMSDLKANKIVMFQHRNYYSMVLICGIIIPTFIPWYFWNETFISSFFVASIYRYIISMHMTWSINSFAHLKGYKPYEKNIRPADNFIPMFTTNGEGFHNYHHTFPWDYKASELSFDPRNATTLLIDIFAFLGLASDMRTVPKHLIRKRVEKSGDGSYQAPETNLLKKMIVHIKNALVMCSIVCIV